MSLQCFLGVDATRVPFRASLCHQDGNELRIFDLPPIAVDSEPLCSWHRVTDPSNPPDDLLILSTSISEELLRKSLDDLKSRLSSDYSIIATAIAHPAMLVPQAVDRIVKIAIDLKFPSVAPIAAPLAAVLYDLRKSSEVLEECLILACTTGLMPRIRSRPPTEKSSPTWEWLRVKCSRGRDSERGLIVPDWFCMTWDESSASSNNDSRDLWRLDHSLATLPSSQRVISSSEVGLEHFRNRRQHAVATNSLTSLKSEVVEVHAISQGAAEFSHENSKPETEQRWKLSGRIPLAIGVLGTAPAENLAAPPVVYWRELCEDAEGAIPRLTFGESYIRLATLPGFSSSEGLLPRWLQAQGADLGNYRTINSGEPGRRKGTYSLQFPSEEPRWSYNLPTVQKKSS